MTSAQPSETARSLATVARSLLGEWGLTEDSDEVWGRFSHVVPVRTADGVPAVLKVAPEDPETEHEALALQHWGGRGAVRLLRADPRRRAVLLERLERRDLTQEWDVHACEAVADLYRLLHVPAPPQLRPGCGSRPSSTRQVSTRTGRAPGRW